MIVGGVKVGRNRTVVEHATRRGRNEQAADPASAKRLLRSDTELMAKAVMLFATDTTAVATPVDISAYAFRQNSGEGRHFLLPADEETNFLALRLGAWLQDIG